MKNVHLILFILSSAVVNEKDKLVNYSRLALQGLLHSSFIIYNYILNVFVFIRNIWREKKIYLFYVLLVTIILYVPFRLLFRLSISTTYLVFFYIGIGVIGVFSYIINVLLYKNSVLDKEDWLKYLSNKLSCKRLFLTFIYCILFTVSIGILIVLLLPNMESYHKEIVTFFMFYIRSICSLFGEDFYLHEVCTTYSEHNKGLQDSVVPNASKKELRIGRKGLSLHMEKDNGEGPSKPRPRFSKGVSDKIVSREVSPIVRESPPLVVEGLGPNDKGKKAMTAEEVSKAIADRGKKRLAEEQLTSPSKRQRTNSIGNTPALPVSISEDSASISKQVPIHTKKGNEKQLHKGKISFIIDPLSSDTDSSSSYASSKDATSVNSSRENSVDIPTFNEPMSPETYYKKIKPLLNEYEKNDGDDDTKSEAWLQENIRVTPRIKAGLYEREQLYPAISETLPNAKLREINSVSEADRMTQRFYKRMTVEQRMDHNDFYKPETYVSVEDVKRVEKNKQEKLEALNKAAHIPTTEIEKFYARKIERTRKKLGLDKLIEYEEKNKREPADTELSPAELVWKIAKSKTQPGEDYLSHVPIMRKPDLAPFLQSDRIISTEAQYLQDIIDPYDPSLRNSSRWDFNKDGSVVPFCFRSERNKPIIDRSILHLCIGPNIMENWHKSILDILAKHDSKTRLDPGVTLWVENTPRKFYNIKTRYLLNPTTLNDRINKWLEVRGVISSELSGKLGRQWIEPYSYNPNSYVEKIFGYQGNPSRAELYNAFTDPNSKFRYNLVYNPMDVAQRYTYLIFDPSFGTSVYTNELVVWNNNWFVMLKHPDSVKYEQIEYFRKMVKVFRVTLKYMDKLERLMAYIEYRGTILTTQEGIDALSCMVSLRHWHDARVSSALLDTMKGCRSYAKTLNLYITSPLDHMKEVLLNYIDMPKVPKTSSVKVQPTVIEPSDFNAQAIIDRANAILANAMNERDKVNKDREALREEQELFFRQKTALYNKTKSSAIKELVLSTSKGREAEVRQRENRWIEYLEEERNLARAEEGNAAQESNVAEEGNAAQEGNPAQESNAAEVQGSEWTSRLRNVRRAATLFEDDDFDSSNEADNILVGATDSGSDFSGNNSNVASSSDSEEYANDTDSTDLNKKKNKSKWTAVNR